MLSTIWLWLNEYRKKLFGSKKVDVLLFGASKLGQQFLRDMSYKYNVVGFIDNDERKIGTTISGIQVFSVQQVKGVKYELLIITSQYRDEISEQLKLLELDFIDSSECYFDFSIKLNRLLLSLLTAALYFVIRTTSKRQKGKILHLISNSYFTLSFLELLDEFDCEQNRSTLVWARDENKQIHAPLHNVETISVTSNQLYPGKLSDKIKLFKKLSQSDKVIIHGFSKLICFPFLIDRKLVSDSAWVGWGGGDIYSYLGKRSFWGDLWCDVKTRLPVFISMVPSDFDNAKARYNFPAKHYRGFYPNPLPAEGLTSLFRNNQKQTVLVGHAANVHMHHKLIFEAIQPHTSDKTVIAPMSYGIPAYTEEITRLGESLFEDFIAKTDFLAPAEYVKFLSSINIAIFHTKVQIAMSTIYALIYNGSTLYFNAQNVGIWELFVKDIGLILRDSNDLLAGDDFKPLSIEEQEHNIKAAGVFFDRAQIYAKWETVFKDLT